MQPSKHLVAACDAGKMSLAGSGLYALMHAGDRLHVGRQEMISGTSNISLNLDPIFAKSGPVHPVFIAFIIPKRLQRILESIWEHPGKILFLEI